MTYRVLSVKDGEQQTASLGETAPIGDGRAVESSSLVGCRIFHVTDVDTVLTAATAKGGSVLMTAADVPDVGRISWLADPFGAVFALLKPDPRM
ncbi:hypothetical protein ACFU6S_32850 [Streptomyces sp. NPDC057456]|uniref:hypothetical protein n=1 Tax=Streptomyces sp. NPDC057456 TaxID=3346139 RepID=UPI00369A9F32